MRRAIFVLLMTAAACRGAQQTAAPQQLPPADVQRTLLIYYECEECQSGELQAVVRLGDNAVAPLAQVLRDGPPADSIAKLQQHLVTQYQQDANDARLRNAPAPPMSQDETVALYTENYTRMYRTRAARALGAIGGTNARAALTRAQSLNLPPEVQAAIKQALNSSSR